MQGELRRLTVNFFSLTLLRGFDRISPVITLPFLTRTLGLELVGTLVLIQSVCYYFTIFTGYGFAYSATRRIAIDRDSRALVSETLSAVLVIKLMILTLCSLAALLLVSLSPTYGAIQSHLWTYFLIIGIGTFFPTWLFQGLEKMQLITLINVFFKSAMIVWMFLYMKGPADFGLYLKMLAVCELFRCSFAWGYIAFRWKLRFIIPSLRSIFNQLKEGLHIFLSNLSIQSYGRLPALVIAPYFGLKAVGIYAIGARLVRSLNALIEPLMQAFFPYVSRKINESPKCGIQSAFLFLKWMGLLGFVIGLLLFTFADQIVFAYSGSASPEAAMVLRALAYVPFVVVLSNILGLEILVPLNQGAKYSLTMWLSFWLCTVLLITLVPKLSALGAGLSILFTETFAALSMGHFVYWYSRKISKGDPSANMREKPA